MHNRPYVVASLLAALSFWAAAPALAQGEILITQAKANAGGITPGDTAGFPVTLSRPGAYILGSNLTVPANKTGIVVTTFNVDIDMNGFRLDGANSTGTKVANYGVHGLSLGISRIHDGIITRFKFHGIVLAANSDSWVVEDMQILANNGTGIYANTAYSRFMRNSVLVNGGNGIVCGNVCHIEGNNVSDNGAVGIQPGSGMVLGNTIYPMDRSGLSQLEQVLRKWVLATIRLSGTITTQVRRTVSLVTFIQMYVRPAAEGSTPTEAHPLLPAVPRACLNQSVFGCAAGKACSIVGKR